jgi:hypothetical protein
VAFLTIEASAEFVQQTLLAEMLAEPEISVQKSTRYTSFEVLPHTPFRNLTGNTQILGA